MLTRHSPVVVRSCDRVSCFPRERFARWAAYTADRLAFRHDGNDIGDYVPGWDADRFEPSPQAEAQLNGFHRGYGLDENASPPSDLDALSRACWLAGYIEGVAQRRRDDQEREEFERELEEAAWGRDDLPCDEVIRAVGCIAARQSGGGR